MLYLVYELDFLQAVPCRPNLHLSYPLQFCWRLQCDQFRLIDTPEVVEAGLDTLVDVCVAVDLRDVDFAVVVVAVVVVVRG